MSKQQTIDEMLMLKTVEQAKDSYTCLRPPRPSFAMIANQYGIIVSGNCTSPEGSPTCKEAGECEIEYASPDFGITQLVPHCVRTIHAEVKALLNAARYGISTNGATLYTVNKPCYNCSKAIIAAGIVRVCYAFAVYDEPRTTAILKAAGVTIVKIGSEVDYVEYLR